MYFLINICPLLINIGIMGIVYGANFWRIVKKNNGQEKRNNLSSPNHIAVYIQLYFLIIVQPCKLHSTVSSFCISVHEHNQQPLLV